MIAREFSFFIFVFVCRPDFFGEIARYKCTYKRMRDLSLRKV